MGAQKGVLQANHIAVNSYTLSVAGMPDLTPVTIGGIEEELDVVDLPDRTVASGGRTKAVSFDMSFPAHHTAEINALELWFQECQDPVSPLYKKPAVLAITALADDETQRRVYTLPDLFPGKRALPDLDMNNEGEMALVTYTFHASDIIYVP